MISLFEVSNEASMKQAKAFWIEQYIPSKEDAYMLISHFLSELIEKLFMSHEDSLDRFTSQSIRRITSSLGRRCRRAVLGTKSSTRGAARGAATKQKRSFAYARLSRTWVVFAGLGFTRKRLAGWSVGLCLVVFVCLIELPYYKIHWTQVFLFIIS